MAAAAAMEGGGGDGRAGGGTLATAADAGRSGDQLRVGAVVAAAAVALAVAWAAVVKLMWEGAAAVPPTARAPPQHLAGRGKGRPIQWRHSGHHCQRGASGGGAAGVGAGRGGGGGEGCGLSPYPGCPAPPRSALALLSPPHHPPPPTASQRRRQQRPGLPVARRDALLRLPPPTHTLSLEGQPRAYGSCCAPPRRRSLLQPPDRRRPDWPWPRPLAASSHVICGGFGGGGGVGCVGGGAGGGSGSCGGGVGSVRRRGFLRRHHRGGRGAGRGRCLLGGWKFSPLRRPGQLGGRRGHVGCGICVGLWGRARREQQYRGQLLPDLFQATMVVSLSNSCSEKSSHSRYTCTLQCGF